MDLAEAADSGGPMVDFRGLNSEAQVDPSAQGDLVEAADIGSAVDSMGAAEVGSAVDSVEPAEMVLAVASAVAAVQVSAAATQHSTGHFFTLALIPPGCME